MDDSTVLRDATTAAKQLARLVGDVGADDLRKDTPCAEWNVGQLLDHLHATTLNFDAMAQGKETNWGRQAPASADRAADLSDAIDELVAQWENNEGASDAAGMAVPEYAVHAWDLASALGRGTDELDPSVAESGLAFMTGMLTDDKRAPAFGPEQQVPDGANAYDRLAAFSGRPVDEAQR